MMRKGTWNLECLPKLCLILPEARFNDKTVVIDVVVKNKSLARKQVNLKSIVDAENMKVSEVSTLVNLQPVKKPPSTSTPEQRKVKLDMSFRLFTLTRREEEDSRQEPTV